MFPAWEALLPQQALRPYRRTETTVKIHARTKIRNFTTGWNIARGKKSPGLGAQTRGRG